jgi:hypothetical protein
MCIRIAHQLIVQAVRANAAETAQNIRSDSWLKQKVFLSFQNPS